MVRPKKFERTSHSSVRDPRKIGDVLTDLMAFRGYGQVQAADECQQAWKQVAGDLAQFTEAAEIKRGTLHVVASNAVVIQELTFRKAELLAAMARRLPQQNIKGLRFRQGLIR